MLVNHATISFSKRYAITVPLIVVLMGSLFFVSTALNAQAMQVHVSAKSSLAHRVRSTLIDLGLVGNAPPTDAKCRAKVGTPCYSPQEMRKAYGITSLIDKGITGKGQTIVIIDSFGSPTIAKDLKRFDKGYGLPDPPSFKVFAPLGTVKFDPNNTDMTGWADETTLDVEWSHAIAPGANIVLLTSPVSETEGVQGLPQFLQLEQYALKKHMGKIISQSWAATENTLFDNAGKDVISSYERFYKQADAQHVTIFASAGDSGSSNVDVNNKTYPFPTVGFPASSPYVTAVGGASLYASTSGDYQHETVWDDVTNGGGAGGGGISQYFSEPDYQRNSLPDSVQHKLKGYRGIPDISYNADPYTSILIYESFVPGQAGYYEIGGTSEGAPQWAGIIADANQMAGHPLGFLNPALYSIGENDEDSNYHDITVGNNGYSNVPGYKATTGWDLASGWGTPRTEELIEQLIDTCH